LILQGHRQDIARPDLCEERAVVNEWCLRGLQRDLGGWKLAEQAKKQQQQRSQQTAGDQ
jgi:hypothetical protein